MKNRNVVIALITIVFLLACATVASVHSNQQKERLSVPVSCCIDKDGNVIATYGFDIFSGRVYQFS